MNTNKQTIEQAKNKYFLCSFQNKDYHVFAASIKNKHKDVKKAIIICTFYISALVHSDQYQLFEFETLDRKSGTWDPQKHLQVFI